MSGRPKIEITESLEELKQLMKSQKKLLNYTKLQALYLIKSQQTKTVREIARILNKGETTIHRWFGFYREGGIELLLLERKISGRPKKLTIEDVARMSARIERTRRI